MSSQPWFQSLDIAGTFIRLTGKPLCPPPRGLPPGRLLPCLPCSQNYPRFLLLDLRSRHGRFVKAPCYLRCAPSHLAKEMRRASVQSGILGRIRTSLVLLITLYLERFSSAFIPSASAFRDGCQEKKAGYLGETRRVIRSNRRVNMPSNRHTRVHQCQALLVVR